jgi:hypothetical protein
MSCDFFFLMLLSRVRDALYLSEVKTIIMIFSAANGGLNGLQQQRVVGGVGGVGHHWLLLRKRCFRDLRLPISSGM